MPAPLLTCVMVAFREQAHVRDCVASILDQGFRDVEIIAVDDASPDHAGEILDDLAANDQRLTVVHLERPTSVGEARNKALARASGEYVWFVAALERIPPDALGRVAERLRREAPDILAVGEEHWGPLGTPRRSARNAAPRGPARERGRSLPTSSPGPCASAGTWAARSCAASPWARTIFASRRVRSGTCPSPMSRSSARDGSP